jgi:tight adherence protein B
MGSLLGLVAGIGLLLIMLALTAPPPRPADAARRRRTPAGRLLATPLAEAGLTGASVRGVVVLSVVLAAAVGLLFLAASRTLPVALMFGMGAGLLPTAFVRSRARRRRAELRVLWPDVVDNLASSVRAGRSLPEAVSGLAERGPEPLRPAFSAFAEDYRVGGRFHDALDALAQRLADPTADRIVESLRMARDVGGSDLGRVLRTLSGFLREEARTRAELEARQGWVVNAARLAVAGPWLLLAVLSLRTDAVTAFGAPAGVAILLTGAVVSVVAYRLMLRLGRLPEEERVLAGRTPGTGRDGARRRLVGGAAA